MSHSRPNDGDGLRSTFTVLGLGLIELYTVHHDICKPFKNLEERPEFADQGKSKSAQINTTNLATNCFFNSSLRLFAAIACIA